MSVNHIFLNDLVFKSEIGAEIIEASDVHFDNIRLLSEQTNPMIYVENGNNIELKSLRYSPNPQLLLSINGAKCGNIKLVNTVISNANNQVEYKHGADASMVSMK
jgi:hypothetical protein